MWLEVCVDYKLGVNQSCGRSSPIFCTSGIKQASNPYLLGLLESRLKIQEVPCINLSLTRKKITSTSPLQRSGTGKASSCLSLPKHCMGNNVLLCQSQSQPATHINPYKLFSNKLRQNLNFCFANITLHVVSPLIRGNKRNLYKYRV